MTSLAIARLGKVVSADVASGEVGLAARAVVEALAQRPEYAIDILDSLMAEGAKPEPDEDLFAADIMMLGVALESIRFGIEAGRREATALADRVRRHLIEAHAQDRIEPQLMLLILNRFVAAKLDVGEALQGIMLRTIEQKAGDRDPETLRQGQAGLHELAHELGGDPFDIHAHLNEMAEVLPEAQQIKLALSLLVEADAGLANAALGFLLSSSAAVRSAIAHRLAAVDGAAASPGAHLLLRRMICLRAWLPQPDRAVIDDAIEGMQGVGIEAASWSSPGKVQAYASGFDGSGMQSILLVLKEGRKHAIAALIGRLGMGVRDAWVRHGASKREADALVRSGDQLGGMAPAGLEYVAAAVRQFLAGNAESGLLPPFGLLAFAECAGLSRLDPETTSLEELVARLSAEIEPEWLAPAAVARVLAASSDWPDEQALFESWFEQDDDIEALLGGKRQSRSKKIAVVLTGLLERRRRRWAELLAWTALSAKSATAGKPAWWDLAIVARELLSDRPLADIGLMQRIAEQTVRASEDRSWGILP